LRRYTYVNLIPGFIFKIRLKNDSFYTAIISHNLVSNITLGLVLAQTKYEAFESIGLKDKLQELEDWHIEPFAIIKILIDSILYAASNGLDTIDLRLDFLQRRMGQHTYHNKSRGDPLKMNFPWTTRVLNHLSTVLAMNRMRVKGAQTTASKAEVFWKSLTATRKAVAIRVADKDEDEALAVAREGGSLTELLEAVNDRCENLLARIAYEEQRVQTQLAAVSLYKI
jgi:hypothetical protein